MAIFVAPAPVAAEAPVRALSSGALAPSATLSTPSDGPTIAATLHSSGAAGSTQRKIKAEPLTLYWGRLLFAGVFLLVILVAGYIASLLDLKEWRTLMIHSFELLLGIFTGLLGSEIAQRSAG